MATALVVLRLIDSDKLVFQRRDEGIRVYPGKLTFFGGQIEDNERPEEAAVREVTEETSLRRKELDGLRSIGMFRVPLSDGRVVEMHLFESIIASADFEVYEGQGAEVYSKEEVLARDDLAEVAAKLLTQV